MPLLIIDDLGMRKLPATAGEDLLEIVMLAMSARLLLTSNRPLADASPRRSSRPGPRSWQRSYEATCTTERSAAPEHSANPREGCSTSLLVGDWPRPVGCVTGLGCRRIRAAALHLASGNSHARWSVNR